MSGFSRTANTSGKSICGTWPTQKPTTPIFKPTSKPSRPSFPVFPSTPNKPKTDICKDARFDAATQTNDGSYYFFKGDQYWKLTLDKAGFQPGYPRTNKDWGGLPGSVDASFYNPKDGMTYIIQNDQVGKYRNLRLQPGYPKAISEEFPGMPTSGIDAALLWRHNKGLYFFKGSLYWKFNLEKRRVEDFYPKAIVKNWMGVPPNLDAAVTWQNGKTFFFQGSNYWRFNDQTYSVDVNSRVRYPRTLGKWWLGCHHRSQTSAPTTSRPGTTKAVIVEEEDAGTSRNPRRWQWSSR